MRIVGGRKGPNFMITFAVSNVRGLILHSMQQGGLTVHQFNIFFSEASTASGDGNLTFVFDNVLCHRRAGEAALMIPRHGILYLSAYSPFLNIAENCFSTRKAAQRRSLEEVRDLTPSAWQL